MPNFHFSVVGTLSEPQSAQKNETDASLRSALHWVKRNETMYVQALLTLSSVIRQYEWTVARGFKAPDGYRKEGLFINGQLPGPLIEANW